MKIPMNSSAILATIIASILCAWVSVTRAGGPIQVCTDGQAFVWPNGGAAIPYNPDQGTLGALNPSESLALSEAALAGWSNVPSATVSFVNAGELPVDVDISNFEPYLFPDAPDGLNPVVFDSDGQIFDLLFGPNSGILGFASPEFFDPATCQIVEAIAIFNGPAITNLTAGLDVATHEFGHYIGLDHSVVNGQILSLGDTSGPTPQDPFGKPAPTDVETMYPFYLGPGTELTTLEKDDVATLSTLYPAPGFAGSFTAIQGKILAANGTTPLSGVNVIARNLANPFKDAVSAISGNFSAERGGPFDGLYTLRGLTPGAQYVVYIDQIQAGDFNTPTLEPFPNVEEYYNGPNESNNLGPIPDNPAEFTTVTGSAGSMTTGINIIFNGYKPGDSLPVGDDSFVELPLPFSFRIGGLSFDSVFVNANGNLTFGQPDRSFNDNTRNFLAGPPRIAALWEDLNPAQGGTVSFQQTPSTFTVIWSQVPEYFDEGEVNFQVTLHKGAGDVEIGYGKITAVGGLAGISLGGAVTSGAETPTDLTAFGNRTLNMQNQPAVFELFDGGHPNDLAGHTLRFTPTSDFNDRWAEPNNSVSQARHIALPFNSSSVQRYTEIEPVGADVDYFSFRLEKDDMLLAEITSAHFDSLLGLFSVTQKGKNQQATLVASDDDSGSGNLSFLAYQVPESGDYALAVTAFGDSNFVGTGDSGGRYVLDLKVAHSDPDELVFNGSFEFGLFGWTNEITAEPFIPWTVSRAGDGSGFDMAPTAPQDGERVLWNGFDGDGPMQFLLYQDVKIPAGTTQAVLSWKDRVQWNFLVGTQTQQQTYEVQVRDPVSNAVLQTLHGFNTGIADGLGDTGWQSHSADLSAFIGQTIRIWFEETIPESFTGPGQFELDAVSLK